MRSSKRRLDKGNGDWDGRNKENAKKEEVAADKTGNEKIQDVLCDDRTVFYTVLFIHGFACACLDRDQFYRFQLLLDDDVFKKAFKNTIIFAVITGPLSYIMCFLFAWIINEFKGKLRAFLTLIFYAPSISGNAFMVWAIIISGDRYGYLNGWLMKWSFLYVLPILIIVQLWLSLGTGFLTFIAGLQTVDKSLYEAGAMDGIKNRWQELWYITIPSMRPQLMFGAVMQITQSFAVADISINLAGNPSVNYSGATIVTHLIDYGSGTRYEMGYACAIATVLFALMVGTNQIVQKAIRRVGE